MKRSVLIIAHNESKHIKNCIQSVLSQNQKADEIVVICHNCTDDTVSIAQTFNGIKVVEYNGPEGVPYARIKGFQEVAGDIVACLDGDSIAEKQWLENVTTPLVENKSISIVAGYVILTNDLLARLTSFWQFVILKKLFRIKINSFAWGSNFACRKADYDAVGGIEPLLTLKEKIGLHFWAEDFYLSLALMQKGALYFALQAKTYTQLPYWKIDLKTAPVKKWREDNSALIEYFKKK